MARTAREPCRVIVLGSTGSIGTQTLEVIDHLNGLHGRGTFPNRFEVVGLAAGGKLTLLREQAGRFGVRETALGSKPYGLVESLRSSHGPSEAVSTFRHGEKAARELVEAIPCDLVVAAMSGSAGLPATLAAVELGRDVALANKETLVAAGELVVGAAKRSGSRLFPVDSEHSGVWQALGACGRSAPPMMLGPEVSRIILTASGGPFRTWSAEETARATPEQALNHPTWKMGPKVTVDSASLMNKALELIEAHWLFGLGPERMEVLIHPQSLVHAIVEFADGSSLAQLGDPDMRTPIQFALAAGAGCAAPRPPGIARRVAWAELRSLDFEPAGGERFPALALARRAIAEGGTVGATLNGANEAAVEAFLAGAIPFGQITGLVRAAMDELPCRAISALRDVEEAQDSARVFVRSRLS